MKHLNLSEYDIWESVATKILKKVERQKSGRK